MAATAAGRPIVAGVDGSPSSLRALDWAADQTMLTGSALQLVAAWDWPRSYGWAVPLPEGYNPESDAERVLHEAAARARARHPDLPLTTTAMQGHPALVLVDASRGAGLLVVGSRGHGEFTGMLLGSVSEHCAAHARCPVLVFRSADQDG